MKEVEVALVSPVGRIELVVHEKRQIKSTSAGRWHSQAY